jgi:hypothetical protein
MDPADTGRDLEGTQSFPEGEDEDETTALPRHDDD